MFLGSHSSTPGPLIPYIGGRFLIEVEPYDNRKISAIALKTGIYFYDL